MATISPNDRVWELEREVFQLRTLFEVAQMLTVCRDSQSIYTGVLAILAGTFGVERAAAFSCDGEAGAWRCMVCRGEHTVESLNARLIEAHDFNFEQIQRRLGELFEIPGENFSASATLVIQEQPAGAFFLGSRLSGEPYRESDRELLEAVASYTAAALENLQLLEALREAHEKLRLENVSLREAVKKEFAESAILGQSEAIQRVLTQARHFAKSEA
ncbi:MAG: hypothetical protein ONA90_01765, partial [candidate division KSB1 bacterium]|nr:hypothetical protein [candidate division KSB1 bacterium]